MQGQGSEAAGYKAISVANFGPLGEKRIEDVPYSVTVVPQALIDNTITVRADDLYKIVPGAQSFSTSTRGLSPNFILRGYSLANGQGTAEDGLRFQNLFIEPIEDKERVEVFTGLTSFLYGPNNVGGLVNYVYKRPTFTRFESLTVGDEAGSNGFIHGDFGGPIDKCNQFFYRINLVGQDGQTAVNTQSIRRNVVTAAISYRPTNDFDLTFIGSHTNADVHGADVAWNFATNSNGSSKVFHGPAPDPTLNFGQPFAQFAVDRNRIGADLSWHAANGLTFRTGYAFNTVTQTNNIFAGNNVNAPGGLYSQTIARNTDFNYIANSGYSAVDGEFDTAFIHHKVTAGYYANNFEQRQAPTTYGSTTFNNLNFITPTYFALPNFPIAGAGPVRTSSANTQRNGIIGDDVKFNQYVSALVGANYTTLTGQNYNTTTGAQSSAFGQSRLSPSLSLLVKPVSWITTYGTYSESLQAGQNVTSSAGMIFTNSGQTLAPFSGRSIEVGAKADIGATLVTLAFFDIDQALQYNQYNNNNTYTAVQNGRQRDRGIELDAVGTVFTGFRVFGGLTFLDPRVEQSQTTASAPAVDGLRPQGVASFLAKLTAEYDLPFFRGLTLTGGVYHIGSQAVDRLNTEFLSPFTTEDIGFRYRTQLYTGNEFILRFDVKNVTNKNYWLTTNYVGQPRTYAFSAETRF